MQTTVDCPSDEKLPGNGTTISYNATATTPIAPSPADAFSPRRWTSAGSCLRAELSMGEVAADPERESG